MKQGDLDTLIAGALSELVEAVREARRSEEAIDAFNECKQELIQTVLSAQVDLPEKAIGRMNDSHAYDEDTLTNLKGALLRQWSIWSSEMTKKAAS